MAMLQIGITYTAIFLGIVHMTLDVQAQAKHDKFDFDKWTVNAACDKHILTNSRGSVGNVTSPYQLVFNELHRIRLLNSDRIKSRTPVDVFVWSLGEPKHPFLTKIGGIPYRERSLEWPTFAGQKANFVGQICFIDSLDLIDKKLLKGDVLLLFCSGDNIGFETEFYSEWKKIGIPEEELLMASECPTTQLKVPILNGVIHRSNDYLLDDSQEFIEFLFDEIYNPECLAVFHATKIGGLITASLEKGDSNSNRHFIATLAAIIPNMHMPLLNVSSKTKRNEHCLNIGDLGQLIIYLDGDGNAEIEMSSDY